ncbi:unnamed protein product [Closterium sp. Naga37s-1]|nr:unnamed protein product [Closterium sp. Naga37s-1]
MKAQKGQGEESGGKVQLVPRADMVHYLDVNDGWGGAECESCLERAVCYLAQCEVYFANVALLRDELRKVELPSVPLALGLPTGLPSAIGGPSTRGGPSPGGVSQARAAVEFSSRVTVFGEEGQKGQVKGQEGPDVQWCCKCELAPLLCAEAMVTEWMAEPRVGVLMDLGRIRSRLPVILAATETQQVAYPAILAELGAGRQAEQDCFASMLVQVLGVKESAHLKEGFGVLMQNLLSGGLEKAHAEEKGRGGAGGAAWGAYLRRLIWVYSRLETRKGEDCFCIDASNPQQTRVETAAIEEARDRVRRAGLARGVSERAGGAGGAEGAKGAGGAGGAEGTRGAGGLASDATEMHVSSTGLVPVNTNPAVAVVTYQVGCILQWARIYGSNTTLEKNCFKDSPQGKVLPMRHPLRDLPSLLLRFGAIPEPLDGRSFSLEWEEWPQGEEAALKLPDDPSARCFGLGIPKADKRREESKDNPPAQSSKAGGRRRDRRNKWRGGEQGGMKNPLTRTPSSPPTTSHRPIVRCAADVECILEFAAAMLTPPDCSECKRCIKRYTSHIPFVTLVANFAYRPASVLFYRFLSVFLPHSKEFNNLVRMLGLDPLPMGASLEEERENLERVREQAERVPVALLLSIALRWPCPILVPGGFEKDGTRRPLEAQGWVGGGRFWSPGAFGDGGGGEEDCWDDGEVWAEVWSWCGAAMLAWPAYVSGGSETCRGRREGKASEPLSPEAVYDLCRGTAHVRYRGDMEAQVGVAWWRIAAESAKRRTGPSTSLCAKPTPAAW